MFRRGWVMAVMDVFIRRPSIKTYCTKPHKHFIHPATRSCRAVATAAATSPGQQQHSQIRGPPCFTLEASVGAANSLDLQLLSTGAFGAEVHPDLPIATTWHGLYKQLVLKFGAVEARKQANASASKAAAAAAAQQLSLSAKAAETALAAAGAKPVLHVATVGAQLRSVEDAAEGMCWAAGVTPTGRRMVQHDHRPHADALLIVSGSHPVRQLPLAQQLLPGTLQLLQKANQMKQRGVLPAGLELWAVANPVTEKDASYLEQKVAAGAQVILTQPPLDWPAFEVWMDDARRRGLTSAARLLIGFPCISGAANCSFWLALCNAGRNQQCKALEERFRDAEREAAREQQQQHHHHHDHHHHHQKQGSSVGTKDAFMQQWNRQLLAKLQATAGVSGLHVMPITSASKRLALQLAEDGAFSLDAWPLVAAGSSRKSTSAVDTLL